MIRQVIGYLISDGTLNNPAKMILVEKTARADLVRAVEEAVNVLLNGGVPRDQIVVNPVLRRIDHENIVSEEVS